jgi:hypothetical protein
MAPVAMVGPHERCIEKTELASEHSHRPAVGGNMMHHQDQHVLAILKPQQPDPHQRSHTQVERPGTFACAWHGSSRSSRITQMSRVALQLAVRSG